MNKQDRKDMKMSAYFAAKNALDYLIMATPTGPEREMLTEANIHLLRAEAMFENKGPA